MNPSELMAEYASQGRGSSHYIPKNKWEATYLNNIDKNLEINDLNSLKKDLDYSKSWDVDIIKPEKINTITHRFKINNNKEKIWDIWLIIHNNNDCEDPEFNFKLRNITISISFGGQGILTTIKMVNNLFLASLLNKKVIYEDDKILVPIVLLDLMYPKKFPLYLLHCHTLEIEIGSLFKRTNMELKYNWCQSKNKKKGITPRLTSSLSDGFEFNILQISENSFFYNHPDKVKIESYRPTQLLLFEIFDFDEISTNDAVLQKVKLYLNGQKPIVFSSDMGEIIKFNILDRVIYAMSLCSKFRYKEDIKRLFFRDTGKFSLPEGINFSGIEKKEISFEFDMPFKGSVKISYLNTNLLRVMYGMAGLAYAS